MSKPFDFNQVGKRLPYDVPFDFFESMEADVLRRIAHEPSGKPQLPRRRGRAVLRIAAAALSVAAVVALFFVINPFAARQESPDIAFAGVEAAYESLDNADRLFLQQVYDDDVYFEDVEQF